MVRQYQVQSTMFISPHSHAQRPVYEPDKSLVNVLHKLLDTISNDNNALAIDHVVAQLLRVHTPPSGMFDPELILEEQHHDNR